MFHYLRDDLSKERSKAGFKGNFHRSPPVSKTKMGVRTEPNMKCHRKNKKLK